MHWEKRAFVHFSDSAGAGEAFASDAPRGSSEVRKSLMLSLAEVYCKEYSQCLWYRSSRETIGEKDVSEVELETHSLLAPRPNTTSSNAGAGLRAALL